MVELWKEKMRDQKHAYTLKSGTCAGTAIYDDNDWVRLKEAEEKITKIRREYEEKLAETDQRIAWLEHSVIYQSVKDKDELIARLKEMLIEERAQVLVLAEQDSYPFEFTDETYTLKVAKEQIEKELKEKEPEPMGHDPRQKYVDSVRDAIKDAPAPDKCPICGSVLTSWSCDDCGYDGSGLGRQTQKKPFRFKE
jgi:hypothetical protein